MYLKFPSLSKEFLELRLLKEHKYCYELAKEVGCHLTTIYNYIKRYKLKVNRSSKFLRHPIVTTGKQYGDLTVLKRGDSDKNRKSIWICKCICGKVKEISGISLRLGLSKSCGCAKTRFKGYGKISFWSWNRIRDSAKQRGMDFSINIEDAWDLFLKQNKQCALSGVPLNFGDKERNKKDQTASLDRIDCTKGYVKDNIQWIHKILNIMKGTMKDEELFFWSKLIYVHNKEKADKINLSANNIQYNWRGYNSTK